MSKATALSTLACLCLAVCALDATESRPIQEGANHAREGPRLGSTPFENARFVRSTASVRSSPADRVVTSRKGLGEHTPYPGSEFLGMGYDAVMGNPGGDGTSLRDPGFRGRVIRFGWCQSDECLSRDMAHLRPMKSDWARNPSFVPFGYARPEGSCQRGQVAQSMSSLSEYLASLKKDVRVGDEEAFFGGMAPFSGSKGMSKFQKQVIEKGSEKFQVKSYCKLYTLGFDEAMPGTWLRDPVLRSALHALPVGGSYSSQRKTCAIGKCFSDREISQYLAFFEDFGTHFTRKVTLGGRFSVDIVMAERSSSLEESEKRRTAIEASFNGFTASGSFNLNSAAAQSQQRDLQSIQKSVSASVLGGIPPQDGEGIMSAKAFGLWARSVVDHPMPIQYNLVPISTTHHFKAAVIIYAIRRGFPISRRSGMLRPFRPPTNMLHIGEKLFPTQKLVSTNKAQWAVLTEGGELQVYRGSTIVWRSHSKCAGNFCSKDAYVAISFRCQLKIYEDGQAIWQSSHRGCRRSSLLYMNDDGNLEVYDTAGKRAWFTGTKVPKIHTHPSQSRGWGSW